VKPVTLILPLVLATLGTVACGGKESLKQAQAARRAALANASQPLNAPRKMINRRSGLLAAGGHALPQSFTRLFGKPSKSVITRPPAPSAPASSLFTSKDFRTAPPPPLPTRSVAPRPPTSFAAAPDTPADSLGAFTSSARGSMAAEKRPPQIGLKSHHR